MSSRPSYSKLLRDKKMKTILEPNCLTDHNKNKRIRGRETGSSVVK